MLRNRSFLDAMCDLFSAVFTGFVQPVRDEFTARKRHSETTTGPAIHGIPASEPERGAVAAPEPQPAPEPDAYPLGWEPATDGDDWRAALVPPADAVPVPEVATVSPAPALPVRPWRDAMAERLASQPKGARPAIDAVAKQASKPKPKRKPRAAKPKAATGPKRKAVKAK